MSQNHYKNIIEDDYPNEISFKKSYEEIKKYKKGDGNYKNKRKVIFSRKIRYFIFIILVLVNILVNMDHGTIPGATDEIKMDLNIDKGILGLFGSFVFLGNLIGKFDK